ncbi:MAG: DNA helicase UvrD [Candidatus Omnitrophica bacterium]|nr:DNA helicase UvrD [Candidatus Omnitrophota bacterium]
MRFVADFHIHSKYSRATSKGMEVPTLAKWAKIKGIGLLGTGDFTHHLWLQELKQCLSPLPKQGLYEYDGIHFVLSAEVSNIYSQNGRGYRVHTVLLAPSFEIAEEINKMLSFYGNLSSDGRPILGSMSCIRLAEEVLKISPDIMIIPAHIWTPWFSVFGSNSGFDSLEEAFGKYTEKITALETGLSSDPAMNWRLSALDRFSLVSNSDSHSPSRIGRESNVFDCGLNYWDIKRVLEEKDRARFLYTVEFYPEEGKYHLDGHRNCDLRMRPAETKQHRGICPVCQRQLTKGVLYRVEELADRPEGFIPENSIPYRNLVPLDEIVAAAKGMSAKSKAVQQEYMKLIHSHGSEFEILIEMDGAEIGRKFSPKLADAIMKVREGTVSIRPGYDGEYGVINLFEEAEECDQLTFF